MVSIPTAEVHRSHGGRQPRRRAQPHGGVLAAAAGADDAVLAVRAARRGRQLPAPLPRDHPPSASKRSSRGSASPSSTTRCASAITPISISRRGDARRSARGSPSTSASTTTRSTSCWRSRGSAARCCSTAAASLGRPGRRAFRSRTSTGTSTCRSAATCARSPTRAVAPRAEAAAEARRPTGAARPTEEVSHETVVFQSRSPLCTLSLSAAAGGQACHQDILATGGTIAGAQANAQSYGYKSGSFKVEDLINAVPQLKELADLSGEQVANIGSQDMNDESGSSSPSA